MTVLALVHDDGHVVMAAEEGGASAATLLGFKRLLDELAVTGWRVDTTMGLDAAMAAGFARDGCTVCGPYLPCGCGLGRADAGGCPHGGGELLAAAQARLAE